MQGNIEQNDNYVSKEGDVTTLGDESLCKFKSKPGWGSHIEEINEVRQTHKDDSNKAFEEHFPTYVKFPTLKKQLQEIKKSQRYQNITDEDGYDQE